MQGTVLEPCKVALSADLGGNGSGGDVQIRLSDLRVNLSPDVAELALSLQASLLEPLAQPPPDRCMGTCKEARLHVWPSSWVLPFWCRLLGSPCSKIGRPARGSMIGSLTVTL